MRPRTTAPQDVLVAVGGEEAPTRMRLVGRLKTRDATGAPMFLVVDETGIPRIAREAEVVRLTTTPILRAEAHISSVITSLSYLCVGDGDEAGELITRCVGALNDALYELSKPEAAQAP